MRAQIFLDLRFAVVSATLLLCPAVALANEDGKAQDAGRHTLSIAGLTVDFTPQIGAETGYDSNLDSSYDPEGSRFARVTGGLDVTARGTDQSYTLSLHGNNFRFGSLERDHRWDVDARLAAHFNLTNAMTLDLESAWVRDAYSASPADVLSHTADFSQEGEHYVFRLRGKSTIERSRGDFWLVSEDGVLVSSTPTGSLFNERGRDGSVVAAIDAPTPLDRPFDFTRNEVRASLLWNKRGVLQPFLIGALADIAYPRHDDPSAFDRNASELYAIAGLRLKPQESFWVDVGGRANRRTFDDAAAGEYTTDGLDVRVHWEPTDALTITARLEQFIREPTVMAALADDVHAYGVTLDWQISTKVRMSARGSYERVEAVGDALSYDKLIGRFDLFYRLDEKVELYTSVLGRSLSTSESAETAERLRIGTGVTVGF